MNDDRESPRGDPPLSDDASGREGPQGSDGPEPIVENPPVIGDPGSEREGAGGVGDPKHCVDEPRGSSSGPAAAPPAGWRKLYSVGRWVVVLLAVVGSLVALVHWSLTGQLSEEDVVQFVDRFGVIAPFSYILLFATLGSFFVPTTVFVVIGVMLFGEISGFLYAVVGGFMALMLGFSATRTLGRQAVSRWLGRSSGKLFKLDHALERSGIMSSMWVRLLYLPNGVINVTFGLSSIRPSHYALGSLLGHIPIVFAITFMAEGVKQAIFLADWRPLLGTEVLIGLVVFAGCMATPFIMKRLRRRTIHHERPDR